ncbi:MULTISPECIES: DUF1152 domain-containing protein [Streptomyces]|uniref:DUF1152 domain-containing protein n=1 Tax=Streptomyces stelliscabiei TaxID=146820 RepID=A0A8I0PGF8_9ACTN|nr:MULTISPECIES: DUF1152 domain-containing protein [Streptomyces]KND42517.1 hypothetical protein IQ64_23245 [Streptomyces stelliscabiei]MBE1602219.1 hypothetical protein [Streptomyces stelliscabiei]MDX2514426.1 DUF1152 domain-containing protein [Streptomyces stelliscabiei]MDX2552308.1 DUF1152 domain-containing protein [Streptomyces stelliscabiei]MDX2611703.1 DUF1152 domain-containing protein [Streptomyces stelliscabiei]
MFSLRQPPFFTRLRDARRVLVAGAGGGFDVYAGLPLALALRAEGKEVHLANLSFADLYGLSTDVWLEPDVAAIGPETDFRGDYFPERALAQWLSLHRLPSTVYALSRTGVAPLRAAYRALVDHLGGVDAVVLVDGGTDILMRGDEHGLGTPEEDMASLGAVAGLDEIPQRLVACLGFGVDAYHGVNHSLVLENLAALEREGAYLGAFSLPRDSREGALYLDAVAHAQRCTPTHPSIVNGSVAAAVRGEFGDVRFTDRTRNSELFINPLMALYFCVDAVGLARRNLYLDRLEKTELTRQISSVVEEFRDGLPRQRQPRAFPH